MILQPELCNYACIPLIALSNTYHHHQVKPKHTDLDISQKKKKS